MVETANMEIHHHSGCGNRKKEKAKKKRIATAIFSYSYTKILEKNRRVKKKAKYGKETK